MGAIDTDEGESWTPPNNNDELTDEDRDAMLPTYGLKSGPSDENSDAVGLDEAQRGGDNSGAGPAIDVPGDESGAGPVVSASGQPQSPVDGGNGDTPGWKEGGTGPSRWASDGIKRIVSYLRGADATHPDSIDKVGQIIDPRGQMTPADRNVHAIDYVKQKYGDEAAWKLMQANRVAYDSKASFARAALQGNGQKPPDLNAAIDAANQGQANVLDGSNVRFSRGHNGGITATVNLPGTKQQQVVELSTQAFGAFLNNGGDGQWDKVMEHSAPVTLARLAKQYPVQRQASPAAAQPQFGTPGKAPAQGPAPVDQPDVETPEEKQQASYDKFQKAHPAPDSEAVRTGKPVEYGLDAFPELGPKAPFGGPTGKGAGNQPAIPGTHDKHGHWTGPKEPDKTGYSEQLRARASEMYPADPRAGQQYMDEQEKEQLNRENKILEAQEKGEQANKRAETAGGWRYKSAEVGAKAKVTASENYSNAKIQSGLQKLQAQIEHEKGVDGRAGASNAMRGMVSLVNSGQIDKMNPQQKAYWDKLTGGPDPAQQEPVRGSAPSVRYQEGSGQQQSHDVPPPDKRVVNQVYTTSKGQFRWMGQGWQRVQ